MVGLQICTVHKEVGIGGFMTTADFTVKGVQEAFKEADAKVPNEERAALILAALPYGSVATALSPSEVLNVLIINRQNGAIERMLNAKRRYDREQAAEERRARRKAKAMRGVTH